MIESEKSTDLLKKLWHAYIVNYQHKIILAVILMMFAAAATAANAWMLQPVLDDIFLNKDHSLLLIIPAVIFALALIKGVATYGQSVIMKSIGQHVTTNMQLDLFQHLLAADIALHGTHSSGKLISKFTNDIHIIRRSLTNVLTGFAKESLTLIFLLGVMVYQSWQLSLITFCVIPLAVYPIIRLGKRMRKVSRNTQESMAHLTAQLDNTFQGVRVVKAYGQEDQEHKRASGTLNNILKLYLKAVKIESAASPIMELLAGIAIAAVIWYGGSQVISGSTTPGGFFAFIGALIMAYKPMKSLAGINTNLQESLASVKRFFEVMDQEPIIQDNKDATALKLDSHDIIFDDVKFTYGEGKPALEGLNITVKQGQCVALVGASGAGKSTIMNLILRFYDPDSGSIKIGGEDIKNVTQNSLRKSVALVNQEATLFDATIAENILYGKPDADKDEMQKAAQDAAAHEFILEQEKAYDTHIGQHGLRLSGGQRQRIAIARAMLRNAPILLLDEATSALDTISERQVQHALERLMKNKTTLVIAHRLSTIMHADVIYVMDEGRVVEHGSHNELLAKNGSYKILYDKQFGST